ncbi:hypothetical protein ACJIZ3_014512 [Penstemon smallii]|uniref:ETFB lysine methyltransferase n=1 Tax=Penstemon smallii TaxID=265156 RepID=A0ABD3RJV8_9LAMI
MSLALSSLRSHFLKHLTPYNSSATFSAAFRRQFIRLPPKNHRKLLRNFSLSVVSYSTDVSFASKYLTVRISCPLHLADMLSESLMFFGASSTTVDEQDSSEMDEEIWISSTFDLSQDVKDCISRAADSVGFKDIPNYEVEMHDHTDWIKQSQESFHPVEITEGLWVVPEWRNPPDLEAINIILNPGLAFGTGEHPTTRLCLLLLQRVITGGEYFLDYGTGSGVLAIAALKFGAELSVGFDIEPQAITSARHNASLNDIPPKKLILSLVPSKNGPQSENEYAHKDDSVQDSYNSNIIGEKDKYDVVIANILLYPLLDLAEKIVSYAKPGAIIGISGIISEQVPTVTKRYSQFMEDITVSMMDDWACISGTKKTNATTG